MLQELGVNQEAVATLLPEATTVFTTCNSLQFLNTLSVVQLPYPAMSFG